MERNCKRIKAKMGEGSGEEQMREEDIGRGEGSQGEMGIREVRIGENRG